MRRTAATRTLQRAGAEVSAGAAAAATAATTDARQPCPAASDADAYPEPPRRRRTFVRKVDRYGTEYHVLTKRRALLDRDPNAQFDFFALPDLVLDLDDEGARHVRSYGPDDERRGEAEWAVSPERAAVKARLRQFEEQIRDSRVKCRQILSKPTNIWRITSYDILSAALGGAAPPERQEAHGHEGGAGVLGKWPLVDKLRVENGIPPHAAEEDEQLLRWMMLRRTTLELFRQKRREGAPTTTELNIALRRQTSMTGIRRLVFQCLDAGTSTESFRQPVGSRSAITCRIRHACERVLLQSPTPPDSVIEGLNFIGNLSDRMSRCNCHVSAPLCGLGLRLSAEARHFAATWKWLQHGHANGLWEDFQASRDVLSALNSFRHMLSDERCSMLHDVHVRRLVFRLLAGIDDNEAMTPGSFRSLAALYLNNKSEIPAQQACDTYQSYLVLLGQLGAARMLWKEWRVSAPQLQARMKWKPTDDGQVACVFREALGQLVGAIAATDDEMRSDLDLDECALLDYDAIETQDATMGQAVEGARAMGLAADEIGSALDLTLEGWMKEVKRLRAPTGAAAAAGQ